jgi:hypothetical protein
LGVGDPPAPEAGAALRGSGAFSQSGRLGAAVGAGVGVAPVTTPAVSRVKPKGARAGGADAGVGLGDDWPLTVPGKQTAAASPANPATHSVRRIFRSNPAGHRNERLPIITRRNPFSPATAFPSHCGSRLDGIMANLASPLRQSGYSKRCHG